MGLSERGNMPKEQINTPARRTVSTSVLERPDPDNPGTTIRGNGLPEGHVAFGWAQDGDRLHDGEHWENTPTLFVNWAPIDADEINRGVVFVMEVDADEILRAAEGIQQSRARYAAGAGTPLIESWPFGTVVLARPELQKMIAITRRARNAAFDADE